MLSALEMRKREDAAHHLREAAAHLSLLADVILEPDTLSSASEPGDPRPPLFADGDASRLRSEPGKGTSNPVFLYAARINDGVPDVAEAPFGQHSSGFCRVVEDYATSRCFPVYVKVELGTDAGDAAKVLRDIADRIEKNPAWLTITETVDGDDAFDDDDIPA